MKRLSMNSKPSRRQKASPPRRSEDHLPDPRHHGHLPDVADLVERELEPNEEEEQGDPHLRDQVDRLRDGDHLQEGPEDEPGRDVGDDRGNLQRLREEDHHRRRHEDEAEVLEDSDLRGHGCGIRGRGGPVARRPEGGNTPRPSACSPASAAMRRHATVTRA